jgi:hypothetical protein
MLMLNFGQEIGKKISNYNSLLANVDLYISFVFQTYTLYTVCTC